MLNLKVMLKALLPLALFFSAGPLLSKENGPALEAILAKANAEKFHITDRTSVYPDPIKRIFMSSQQGMVLSFDYVRVEQTEWFLNLKTRSWAEAGALIDKVLLPKEPSRSQIYFSKQVQITLSSQKPLSLAVTSQAGKIEFLKAYLSRHEPLEGEGLSFFPPEPLPYPTLRGAGSEAQFWPLVVMELNMEASTFEYYTQVVPLSLGHYSGRLIWINTSELNREDALVWSVQIRPTTVHMYREEEAAEIDKERLQLEANSYYMQSFLGWFVPLWQELFPRGRSVRVKPNAQSGMSVAADLDPYRGKSCAPFLTVKIPR